MNAAKVLSDLEADAVTYYEEVKDGVRTGWTKVELLIKGKTTTISVKTANLEKADDQAQVVIDKHKANSSSSSSSGESSSSSSVVNSIGDKYPSSSSASDGGKVVLK